MIPFIRDKMELIGRYLKGKGLKRTLSQGIYSLCLNILNIERGTVYRFDLSSFSRKANCSSYRYGFKWGDEECIRWIGNERHLGYNKSARAYAVKRLRQGDKLLLVMHRSQVVGYLWMMFGAFELTRDKYFPIPSTSVCFYRGFAVKGFRGRWIVQNTIHYALSYLKREGFKKVYLVTLLVPFGHLLERMGFQPIGPFWQVTLLFKKLPFLPKKVKRIMT